MHCSPISLAAAWPRTYILPSGSTRPVTRRSPLEEIVGVAGEDNEKTVGGLQARHAATLDVPSASKHKDVNGEHNDEIHVPRMQTSRLTS